MLGTGLLFRVLWGGDSKAPWEAFAVVFGIAGVLRAGSSMLLGRQHEPAVHGARTSADDFTYWEFLLKTGTSNFATFTMLFALLSGAANLTGPFFATFIFRDLGYDYFTYVTFPMCAIVTSMIFVRFWARLADRWGNLFVIRIAALLLAFIPLLYLGDKRLGPLYGGWLMGGMVWSGINLATFNLVTELSSPRHRVRCYAYLQATVALVVAAFMFGWGMLVDHLPRIFHYQIQTVFLCSFVLRLLPALGLVFLVKEPVTRPAAGVRAVFAELPAVRPVAELLRELVRPFSRN